MKFEQISITDDDGDVLETTTYEDGYVKIYIHNGFGSGFGSVVFSPSDNPLIVAAVHSLYAAIGQEGGVIETGDTEG